MKAYRVLAAMVVALTFAGCGGGGGGSSGSSAPALSFSPAQVSVTADASTHSTPSASVAVTISNADPSAVYVAGRYSDNGILAAGLTNTSSSTLSLNLAFRDPTYIGPGVYNDTVYVHLCSDAQCTTTLTDWKLLAVTYTVTGTAPPRPTLTLASTTANAQALPFISGGITTSIPFTYSNILGYRINFSSTTYTTNGIADVHESTLSDTTGVISIVLKPPVSLGVGIYNDVISLHACDLDTYLCQGDLLGTPQSIAVRYEVSNTITGAYGYTAYAYPLTANNLAWDNAHQVLLASVPESATSYANSVVALSPATGAISASYLLGGNPNVLAVSGDGQYVYVGQDAGAAVSRLSLPLLGLDSSIALHSSTTTDPLVASDLQVMPGAAHTVAIVVSKPSAYSPSCVALTIFNDATPLSNIDAGGGQPCISHVQWGGSSTTLYATDGGIYPTRIYTITNGASGLQLSNTFVGSGLEFIGAGHYDSGKVFTRFGYVFDTNTQSLVESFDFGDISSKIYSTLPDVAHGKLFELTYDTYGTGWLLKSYDIVSHSLLATIYISDSKVLYSTRQHNLIRWSSDGIAFTTEDDRVIVINGAFVTQ